MIFNDTQHPKKRTHSQKMKTQCPSLTLSLSQLKTLSLSTIYSLFLKLSRSLFLTFKKSLINLYSTISICVYVWSFITLSLSPPNSNTNLNYIYISLYNNSRLTLTLSPSQFSRSFNLLFNLFVSVSVFLKAAHPLSLYFCLSGYIYINSHTELQAYTLIYHHTIYRL